MPILLIAVLVAGAWWTKNTLEEVPFAMRGKTSPRRQLKMERFKAKAGNSERRYGFARYVADLWASCWKEALQARMNTTDHRVNARTQKAIRKHERRIDRRDRRWARRDDRRQQRQVRRAERRLPPPAPEEPREPCAGCGKSGHDLPYCEKPADSTPADSGPDEMSDRKCGWCGGPAHSSADCPVYTGKSEPQPKENTVSASPETSTVSSLRAAMEAKVTEATAELEDARANANRAAGELARADQMVASLRSQKVPEQTVARVQQLQENAAAAKKTADARAALADSDVALAKAALADVAAHEHVQDASTAAGGVANASFYEQSNS
jgi:hypothetical protein